LTRRSPLPVARTSGELRDRSAQDRKATDSVRRAELGSQCSRGRPRAGALRGRGRPAPGLPHRAGGLS